MLLLYRDKDFKLVFVLNPTARAYCGSFRNMEKIYIRAWRTVQPSLEMKLQPKSKILRVGCLAIATAKVFATYVSW